MITVWKSEFSAFIVKLIFSTNLTDSGLIKILHCGLMSGFNIP